MGQSVTIQLPFVGGLDQKTSAHYLDPTLRLASVVNGNFTKVGQIDKRLGMGFKGTLPSAGRLASFSKADLLSLSPSGANNIDVSLGAPATITNLGPLPPASVVRRPIPIAGNAFDILPVVGDMPFANTTLRVCAYAGPLNPQNTTQYTIFASVYDINTRQVVLPPSDIFGGGGLNTKVFPLNVLYLPNAPAGGQLAVFVVDSNSGIVWAINYNPATNTFAAAVNTGIVCFLGTGLTPNAPPVVDIAPFVNDGTGRYLAFYAQNAGQYYLSVYNPNHTLSAGPFSLAAPGGYVSGGGWTGACGNQCAVYGTSGAGETIWVEYTWSNAAQMRLFVAGFNQAFALTLAATEITGIGGLTVYPAAQATIIIVPPVRLTQTTAWFGWLIATAETGATYLSLGYQGGCAIMTNTALPAQTGAYLPYGFFPIARPFVIGANLYLPTALMLDKTSLQGTVFLLQQTPALTNNYGPIPLPVATSAPRQLDLSCIANMVPKGTGPTTLITGPNHIAFGAVVAPTTYQALAIRTMGSSSPSATVLNGTTGYSGLGLAWDVTLNFHSALQFKSDELNGQLHISGGTPFVCDGQAVSEDNFFYYPEFAFTGTAGTGTTLPTGSYQYVVCYAYADSCGNIARSAPVFTDVRAITNGGAYPTVTFPQLVTWRDAAAPGQTYAEIYRTLTSPAAPVYYLLDRVPCSLTTPQSAAAAFLTYADNLATNTNAALATSSILYTTGGVLDNVCPPASSGQAIHKGRLWAIDDSLQAIWFTQQSQVGAAPGYNESLTIGGSDGGDITALQSMDSELVIFKRNSIWVMYGGDGPASTGTGADEQIPQRVPSDVGCADWRSVVLTPVGIMFAAPTGIYLLDRSLNVTWIGMAVQDLFASYPTCVGAVLVPGNTQVRFAMQSTANTLTTILVYDYVLGQWAQHSYGQQLFGATSLALSQSGVYSLETTDGSVWQENANNPNPGVDQYLDQDSAGVWHFSPTSGTTAEIKITGPGDLQRYQRVRVVQLYADWLESSQITLGLAFNGVPAQVASRTWTAGQLQGLPYDLISMSVPAAYTRCMSVQVLWSDSADAVALPVTGQGVRWAGLALEIEALAGRYPQIPKGNR